ncbi:MAG: UMP kinase [Bacteroidales bacterium]|nr:UMP kinase [Bacteroidales bacterium]MDZ4203498.1 UMP kinase [Bacteroidales bacterium]
MKYKRILLKLSGESLAGGNRYGIDPQKLEEYAREIQSVHHLGAQVAIVLGGGNIFRGLKGNCGPIDRVQGDYMGMLATVINSLGLKAVLESLGIPAVVLGGLVIDPVCEKMSRKQAIHYLEKGNVVIISGGTGNPFFTTDSAAALRAVEIKADVLLKGTRVDGVYSADPENDPTAIRYDTISFDEAYTKGLNIMDLTAFTLCSENNLPLIVFDVNVHGNLLKIVSGEPVGTLVAP